MQAKLPLAHNSSSNIIGRAGASPPSGTWYSCDYFYIYIYIYIRCRTSCPKSSTCFFFSDISIFLRRKCYTVSFSPIFQYFLTYVCNMHTCICAYAHAMHHAPWIRPPWIRPPWNRPPWNRPAWIRPPWNMESSSVDSSAVDSSAREAALRKRRERDRDRRARESSLGADLLIEKEQGRVAGRRLPRKGKLD